MPTFWNGGGLSLWLVLIAVVGLGLLAVHARRCHCDDCGRDTGRHPWHRDGALLCRGCFVRRVTGGR